MVTTSKSSSTSLVTVTDMMTKRSLSVLLFTLALALGSIGLAHAPPSQPPVIGTPVISPTSPTSSNPVTVSVNVTSAHSTIKNVTITYTTDDWKSTNTTLVATYNATTSTTATARIPALASGGHVEYYIVAFDNAGNTNLNNNNGSYFAYDVSAPTSLTSVSTLTYILVAAGRSAGHRAARLIEVANPHTHTQSTQH